MSTRESAKSRARTAATISRMEVLDKGVGGAGDEALWLTEVSVPNLRANDSLNLKIKVFLSYLKLRKNLLIFETFENCSWYFLN